MNDGLRVVVTGMGAVTSLGAGVAANWEAIVAGRSGVRQIRQFRSDDFPVRIGSEVDLDALAVPDLGDELAPFATRSVKLGLVALAEAWRHGGLDHTHDLVAGGADRRRLQLFPASRKAPTNWPTQALEGTNYKSVGVLWPSAGTCPSCWPRGEIGMVSTLLASPLPPAGPVHDGTGRLRVGDPGHR